MSDDLVKRLRGDWFGYDVSLRAIDAMDEAADRIEQMTAERDRLRYERDAILLDGTVHSDQREKYERLCARIAAGKASQQDAVEAIRQLCRDNERLALRRSDARAEAAEAERDSYRKALEDIIADCEADYPPSHGAIKYAARAALKGETP